MATEDIIRIELATDEALVLFDWVHRLEDLKAEGRVTEEPAEILALWALSCALEKILVEPFAPDYDELVEHARGQLIKRKGPPPS